MSEPAARDAPDVPAARPAGARAPDWLLLLAVALTAVPLLVFGRSELIGYDGYWHVFIAGQDDWRTFWAEIRRNAHPPLFYLCLKAAIALFGPHSLAYRLVPIAATLGSTWLVGRIVARTARHPWLPAAAALAFGSSLTAVAIGLDVRAYALATLFMLWAARALLDLAAGGFAEPGWRPRAAFALATSLALLTHYGAALFLAGCCVAAVAPAVVDREVRRRVLRAGWRVQLANLLTFAVPIAVLAVEYAVHIAGWAGRFNHLPTFLFDSARESAPAFVWRNTRALFELFLPAFEHRPFASTLIVSGPGLSAAAAAVLAVLALAALAWLALRPARGGAAAARARRIPALVLLTMTGLLIVLALARRYPYGGPLRHQFFLFPFAVVVLALLVDEIAARSRRLAPLAAALLAFAAVLNAVNWIGDFRIVRGYLQQAQMDRFRAAFPAPEAVFVDQYNFVTLFMHHHDRPWRLVRWRPGEERIDVWRVGGAGDGGFHVCRDNRSWQFDLSSHYTFNRMRLCLQATGARRATVFRPQQRGTTAAWPVAETEAVAAAAAAPAGLSPETVVVEGEDVYATFTRRR